MSHPWSTPFESGNGNQTTTWQDCIAFHQRLAQQFPQWLRFETVGCSDGGVPLHLGVFSVDGEFDPRAVKAAGRAVFFNNNGIHPGEPEASTSAWRCFATCAWTPTGAPRWAARCWSTCRSTTSTEC